jgi:hypothetical protein
VEMAPPIASTRVGLVAEAGAAVLRAEAVGLAVGGKGEPCLLPVPCARCNTQPKLSTRLIGGKPTESGAAAVVRMQEEAEGRPASASES